MCLARLAPPPALVRDPGNFKLYYETLQTLIGHELDHLINDAPHIQDENGMVMLTHTTNTEACSNIDMNTGQRK